MERLFRQMTECDLAALGKAGPRFEGPQAQDRCSLDVPRTRPLGV